jgi:hypothetical protein
MTFLKKFVLGLRMLFNALTLPIGSTPKAHLAMAQKILEIPPEVPGDVIECGTWKGGSAANLSLVCRITGRKLRIYDSFEGLPEGKPEDRESKNYQKGEFFGSLEEVKANIRSHGALECCAFIKGWFEDTLPDLGQPIVLAFVDVDLEASLETCVRYIWPNLVDAGYLFIDEFVNLDYCALFFSEKYWMENFQRTPPGLVGAGTGLALGEYYIGPYSELDRYPLQRPCAGAYTRKDFSGYWTYQPGRGGGSKRKG